MIDFSEWSETTAVTAWQLSNYRVPSCDRRALAYIAVGIR